MKDIFKQQGLKSIGPGGIKCPCCDAGYSKKRCKNKNYKGLFSRLRRTRVKALTRIEILNNL